MPMSPDNATAAAQYFQAKDTARSALIGQIGQMGAIAPGSSFGGGSGISLASSVTPSGQHGSAASTGILPANKAPTGFHGTPGDWANAIVGGALGPLGVLLTQQHFQGGKSALDNALGDAAVASGPKAPQGFTQKAINALTTGDYMSGEILHGMGQTFAQQQADTSPQTPGRFLGEVGNGAAQFFGGAARGLAEGFGARFDGKAPATPSRDMQESGITQNINDAAAKGFPSGFDPNNMPTSVAGTPLKLIPGSAMNAPPVSKAGESTLPGIVAGLGADIVGDPLTFVTGTGFGTGLTHAILGAKDAAVAGKSAPGIIGSALKAGAAGVTEGRAANAADKVAVAEAKAARGGSTPTISVDQQVAAEAAARNAAGAPQPMQQLLKETPATSAPALALPKEGTPVEAMMPHEIQALAIPDKITSAAGLKPSEALAPSAKLAPVKMAPELKPIVDAAVLADPKLAARLGATKDLLPSLSRTVDAPAILGAAKAAPQIGSDTAKALHDIVNTTTKIPQVDAGIQALKATPEGAAFLASKVKVGGQLQPLEKVVSDAASAQVVAKTGGSIGTHAQQAQAALTQAIKVASTGKTSPGSLAGAVTDAGLAAGPVDLGSLFQRVAQAPAGAARESILRDGLASSTGFHNFDRAINAATDGQVEGSMMRSMLKALDVKSTATTDVGLRKALSTQGRLNWEEAQKAIPTAQEVFDNHSITPAVVEASKAIDPEVAAATAAQDYQKIVNEVAGGDPSAMKPPPFGTPLTKETLVAKAIRAGNNTVDSFIHDAAGPVSESFKNTEWLSVHNSIINSLKHVPNMNDLAGIDRITFLGARYAEAINATEKYALSRGVIPFLAYGKTETPFYASFGQIFHALPPDVIDHAMFNLNHTEGTALGLGHEAYKLGLSVYPTTIGNGARAAVEGADEAGIRAALRNSSGPVGLNKYELSPAGQQDLTRIAHAMATPEFRATIAAAHEQRQALAVSTALRNAENIVAPLRDRIIASIDRPYGDRADMVEAVNAADKASQAVAPASEVSLTRDIATQRVGNGVVNTLGEDGAKMVRDGARAAKTAKESRTAAQLHGGTAADTRDYIRDGGSPQPTATQLAAAPEANIDYLVHDAIQGGFGKFFDTVMRAGQGRYGAPLTSDLRAGQESAIQLASNTYAEQLKGFLWSQTVRPPKFLGRAEHIEGIIPQMSKLAGRQVKQPEAMQAVRDWMSALQSAEKNAGGRLNDTQLSAVLSRGLKGDGNKNVAGFDPFDNNTIGMILDLRNLIDVPFHPNGAFMRTGMTGADLMNSLRASGVHGEIADHLPANMDHAQLENLWHTADFQSMDNPLGYLYSMHHAIAQSTMRPVLGGSAAALFDHLSPHAMGKSIPDLISEGWRKIAPSDNPNSLANFIPRDSYFPPEIIKELPHLQQQITSLEAGLPPAIRSILRFTDQVTGYWKSSVTSLNPRHLVTNALGNDAAAVLDGMHPLYKLKSLKAMVAMGHGTLDPSVDAGVAALAKPGRLIKSTFTNPVTTGIVKDAKTGALTKVNIDPFQMLSNMKQRGMWMGGHDAGDLINQAQRRSGIEARPNVFSRGQMTITGGLAASDNLTRMGVAMSAIERRTYGSMEEAWTAAQRAVLRTQPTRASLSTFEKQAASRIFMFYSWSKQMMTNVALLALENPGKLTLYSKAQYNAAEAAGFNPDSYGMPLDPNNSNLPSYELNSPLGPTFSGSFDPTPGAPQHELGLSLSQPQIDSVMSWFGGANDSSKQGPILGGLHNIAGSINPLLGNAAALINDQTPAGIGKAPSADYGKFLLNATGLPGTLANIAGLEAKAPKTSTNPQTQAKYNADQAAQNQSSQARALLNWITGLKFTDYTNTTATSFAKTEHGTDDTKALRSQGYSAQQISQIKKIWKTQQAQPTP